MRRVCASWVAAAAGGSALLGTGSIPTAGGRDTQRGLDSTWNSKRFTAQYGITLQSHEQILRRFSPGGTDDVPDARMTEAPPMTGVEAQPMTEQAFDAIINNLEKVEQRLVHWKLNKWDFRVPVLLTGEERYRTMSQLKHIKTEMRLRLVEQERALNDLRGVSEVLNTPITELRYKSRAWIQEKVSELRWQGDIESAKRVREAWVRLEDNGGREAKLLQRLCCIYGLARIGTFESAFTNFIVPADDLQLQKGDAAKVESYFTGHLSGAPETAENDFAVAMDRGNPFTELMRLLTKHMPTLDILYDFYGYNVTDGYRSSLGRALKMTLEHNAQGEDYGTNTQGPRDYGRPDRVMFQRHSADGKLEFLFDHRQDYSGPDFVYGNGGRIVLISIANPNKWLRETQLPHTRQMEGIARRCCFVFGIPFEQAQVQNLLLPPSVMDKKSLLRLESIVGPLHPALQSWSKYYDLELSQDDADYAEQAKKYPEEEWVRL